MKSMVWKGYRRYRKVRVLRVDDKTWLNIV